MDSGRSTTLAGGLKLSPESAIEQSGVLGTRRGLANIRWYEYLFLALGILAALVTDGLTIARLAKLGSLRGEPEFAYGILIIVHSMFLLLFLITGIFYQRIADIIAFFLSAVLLTIYVIAHYFTPRNEPENADETQAGIRLARLIFTIVFNICFIPLAFKVIKDYDRDEFSKRLFGAFPAARRPLKIYSVFDCVARISTMISISSLVLNLYNFTDSEVIDTIFLVIGIPVTFLWLGCGIGMARLENRILAIIFYILSLFQLGFLIYILYAGIAQQIEISKGLYTTTQKSSTNTPIPNTVPVIQVLYVCIAANLITHIMSMAMGYWCTRNFDTGLKEKVFNNKVDKWVQVRWSSK